MSVTNISCCMLIGVVFVLALALYLYIVVFIIPALFISASKGWPHNRLR